MTKPTTNIRWSGDVFFHVFALGYQFNAHKKIEMGVRLKYNVIKLNSTYNLDNEHTAFDLIAINTLSLSPTVS